MTSLKNKLKYYFKYYFISSLDVCLLKRKKLGKHFIDGPASTLDVGCGNGDFSVLAYRKGSSVLGISILADEAANCNRYMEGMGVPRSRARFEVKKVNDLNELKETFDQIICFEVIEHIKDDEKALKILSDALKPGAVMHISTPNIHGPDLYGDVLDEEELGGHVRKGYSYDGLEKLLARCDLVVTAKDAYGGFFTVKAIELSRRAELYWARRSGRNSKILKILLFALTYPWTFLDPLVPCEPFAIYVTAKKEITPDI